MKLNKKTNKMILQKKDYEIVILKNNYICIDGNYIIKSDLIEFDNLFIIEKINNNEDFGYNFKTYNYLDIDCKTFKIDRYLNMKAQEPVKMYDFYYKDNFKKYRIFTNLANNKTILINSDYAKIIETLRGNISANKKDEFQPVLIHAINNNLLGLFMPVYNKTALNNIHQFILDNTENEAA